MNVNLHERKPYGLGGLEDQEELYQLAVRTQVLRPGQAAAQLGWSVERTARAVRLLSEAMLLQPLPGAEEFLPVTPRAAAFHRLAPLQQQIERMERRSREIQAELVGFHRAHEEALRDVSGSEAQRILAGQRPLREEMASALEECTGEVMLGRPGTGWWAGVAQQHTEEAAGVLQKRDVAVRVIHQHAARFDPATRQHVAAFAEGRSEARTLAGPFEGVIIFDRQRAIVPLEEAHLAVVVREPGLVRFMVEVFERTWRAATEFEGQVRTTEVSRLLSDVRGTIVQLLAEGQTDEVIARRIGVSVRTCRNHIAKIYQELGARSRFQLGVLIARSGLLDQLQNDAGAAQAPPASSALSTSRT
ncbi:LuxR C-terminal-related transcriptional regulator (plasmid) [Streptomyces sp. NBC_01591]|uniref:helix-turn-helix transcriptional regulator n=1 Tax=Streptomyces sp. NBC_01591 TaxID=2975888 RepID=UPI002DD95F4A|nr:LuxR C-terminal-related transcriptional regulator [Streptomyces sp. NBC_01591]WSD73879.1 LuxR C-terminal-related transcriptional regulator [Streptomyces sp. NBC_01591]